MTRTRRQKQQQRQLGGAPMFMYEGHIRRPGWIEIIVGCMFSGKTEELIRLLRRAQLARLNVQVFKPKIDDRYSRNHLASHSQQTLPSTIVESAYDILDRVQDSTDVVGIDEAQFFGPDIVKVVNYLANKGRRVIVTGLDTDWRGQPFTPIPELMSIAEVVRKLYAVCVRCGDAATRTQRLVNSSESILVGATGVYEARCRHCFAPPKLHDQEEDLAPLSI